jgi:hypothetical protein
VLERVGEGSRQEIPDDLVLMSFVTGDALLPLIFEE